MTALLANGSLVLSGFLLFQSYLAGVQGCLLIMIFCAFLALIFGVIGWVLA